MLFCVDKLALRHRAVRNAPHDRHLSWHCIKSAREHLLAACATFQKKAFPAGALLGDQHRNIKLGQTTAVCMYKHPIVNGLIPTCHVTVSMTLANQRRLRQGRNTSYPPPHPPKRAWNRSMPARQSSKLTVGVKNNVFPHTSRSTLPTLFK